MKNGKSLFALKHFQDLNMRRETDTHGEAIPAAGDKKGTNGGECLISRTRQ